MRGHEIIYVVLLPCKLILIYSKREKKIQFSAFCHFDSYFKVTLGTLLTFLFFVFVQIEP